MRIKHLNKENLEIKGITNVEILDRFHKDFYELTGLYTTFVDKDGNFITSARARRPFCIYLAKVGLKEKCDESNRIATKKYLLLKKPVTYKCYAGLGEIISPIVVKGKVIGAVLTGQIKVEGYTDKIVKEKLFSCSNKFKVAKDLYNKIPIISKTQFKAAARLIFLLINYIFEKHYELLIYKGKFKTHKDDIIEQTKSFLRNNYHRNFKLKELADNVHVSSFYLSHLFKEKVGVSIKEYTIFLRLYNAINLLKKNIPFEKVSEKVGYKDSLYLYKLFKKIIKISPYNLFTNESKSYLKNFYKKIAILDIE